MADILSIILVLFLLAVVIVVVILFFILRKPSKPITFEKQKSGKSIMLSIICHVPVKTLKIKDGSKSGKIEFVRQNISLGEKLVFEYPAPKTDNLTITVQTEQSSYDFKDSTE